jgi:hypothetical protein
MQLREPSGKNSGEYGRGARLQAGAVFVAGIQLQIDLWKRLDNPF